MFPLSVQKNFFTILSLYVERHVKKNPNSKSTFYVFSWFSNLQNLHSLWPPVFGFCDSLTLGLEESRELEDLIRWVL